MVGIEDMPLNGKRTKLNVRVTGMIQKEGYRIEKLYYESLPGLYVPANLYIPDGIKEPRAAILYVCGHSRTQMVNYQTHPAKFAKLGFVCLIIETIQYGEVKGEHHGCYSKGWFNWYSRGYNPAGVEAWNAIRGLDLLSERTEVNPEKMGVTGISGGGSQSWYIAALDPRIKAVSPVCGASTLNTQISNRRIDGHCDCMMPVNTYQKDFMDIGALIAPRPLLIAQADGDGLYSIESVRNLYTGIKKIYRLYGEPEKIGLVESPGGHSYHEVSRTKIFSFFMEHLMGKQISPEEIGDIDASSKSLLSAEELQVFVDGVPEDNRTTKIQDSFIQLHKDPEIENETELISLRDSIKKFLKVKTFGAFPTVPAPMDPLLEFRSKDGWKHGEDIYSFVSEEGWRLKVRINWDNEPGQKKPLMIFLRNADENKNDTEDFRWGFEKINNNLKDKWNVAFFEVRGVGEYGWAPNLQWHVRRASAWTGRTVASMQVYDLLRCIEFCRKLDDVDTDKIGITARGEMTVVAMYAALMDGNCKELRLKNPIESQDRISQPDGRGAASEMLNCLRVTDVYQLPALLSPTRILFSGEIPATYQWSAQVLKKLGKGEFERFTYNHIK